MLRVEQGKGKKDRYALLSPSLLEILRAWWRQAQSKRQMLPGGWMFPGQNPVNPLSTRQLNRAFHMARTAAEYANQYIRDNKRDFQQKIPVNVDLVSGENIDKFTAYGKKD